MQIIIDIPEEIYENINNHSGMAYAVEDYLHEVEWAIKNGTQLPKGHGRFLIVSEDVIKQWQTSFSFSCQKWINEVGLSNATTAIIEAVKESEEVTNEKIFL